MDASQPSAGTPADPTAASGAPAAAPPDASLRVSDADRERAVSVLKSAAADGRVSAEELDGRVEAAYVARSKGELAAVVKDLQPAARATGAGVPAKDLGILGDISRKGRWVVGDSYRGTAVISSGVIDLRDAEFTGSETTIHITSWVSTVYVVVPEGVEVEVAGTGVLGGFRQDRAGAGASAAHRITVTGLSVLGTVHVVHQLPEAKARRLRKREQKSIGG